MRKVSADRRIALVHVALLGSLGLLSACGDGGGVVSIPVSAANTPAVTTPTPASTPSVTPSAVFQTSEYSRSTGPATHNVLPAWQNGYNGQGVTIGFVDSGIDTTSPEFAGRISAASADVVSNRGISNVTDDHGTNVALVAAAARDNTGVLGIAYNATLLIARADTPGSCSASAGCGFSDPAIAAGIDRAVQNGAKVINLSLGGSAPSTVVVNAVARAAASGAVIVVSAGNDARANPDPFAVGLRQAGNGNVIIAGSVNASGGISSFTDRAGSEAQNYLTALGEGICCVYQNGVLKVTTNAQGQQLITVSSGTSFSAPQISGAAALLIQAFPNLTAGQVVSLLLSSARDAGATGTDAVYGHGILDIGNAFSSKGVTSLAGSSTQIALGSSAVITSHAMGDAVAQSAGLSAVVLDSYNRAYRDNFGANLRIAPVAQLLAIAVGSAQHHISQHSGPVSLAFTVDGSNPGASVWTGQLHISREDSRAAKVLAGRIVTQFGSGTALALGFAEAPDSLISSLQGRSSPAFQIAQAASDDMGFNRAGGSSFALRRGIGPWGLTLSGGRESVQAGFAPRPGETLQDQHNSFGASRFGVALDRHFGAVASSLALSWLGEDRSVLGAFFDPAFGAHGADSVFVDAALGWHPADRWQLNAAWRQGFTRARSSAFIAPGSSFSSYGWSVDASRSGVFSGGDSLGLRIAQPLRVASGGISLNLPTAYSYATEAATYELVPLSLAPRGRELDTELAWRGALWGGNASASVFARFNPGNVASLPLDKGVALRWNTGF